MCNSIIPTIKQMQQLSNSQDLTSFIGWSMRADGTLIPPKEVPSDEKKSLAAQIYDHYQAAVKVVSWVGDTTKHLVLYYLFLLGISLSSSNMNENSIGQFIKLVI
jgi:hypothetical protein